MRCDGVRESMWELWPLAANQVPFEASPWDGIEKPGRCYTARHRFRTGGTGSGLDSTFGPVRD